MPKSKKLDLKEILLPTISLFAICLAFTAALAAVNAVTAAPIAANLAAQADAARQEIFPGAAFENRGDYFAARDAQGALAGYCVDTQARGYGGAIEVTVGLDPGGKVIKVQVVAAEGETPGLGQKVRDAGFLNQFTGKADAFVLGIGVDGIASATYSSGGVVTAVNRALEIYQSQIKGGEPE